MRARRRAGALLTADSTADAEGGPRHRPADTHGRGHPLYVLAAAGLALVDAQVGDLVQDVEVLAQLAEERPAAEAHRRQILVALDRAANRADPRMSRFCGCGQEAAACGMVGPRGRRAHRVSAAGYAHIASAWAVPVNRSPARGRRHTD